LKAISDRHSGTVIVPFQSTQKSIVLSQHQHYLP